MNLNEMTAAEVAEELAIRDGYDRPRKSLIRMGVRELLGPLEGQPGTTWQHRWVAANPEVGLLETFAEPATRQNKRMREGLAAALRSVVAHEVVRPGIALAATARLAGMMIPGVMQNHSEDLDRMVEAASQHEQITIRAETNMRYAAAALILFTGKSLGRITPSEWGTAEQARRDYVAVYGNRGRAKVASVKAGTPVVRCHTGFFTVVTFRAAYAACQRSGLMTPDPFPMPGRSALPATLSIAMKKAFTVMECLDANGKEIPPRVRALFLDTYAIEAGSFDNSTVKADVVSLNSFMRVVRQHLPGHDSLDVPKDYRDLILRTYINEDARQRKPGTKKTSATTSLINVRGFYNLASAVVSREELTEHISTLGAFPWSTAAIRKMNKNEGLRRTATQLGRVRDQLPHFDELVPAAEHRLARADALAMLARATAPGGIFVYEGRTYRRAMTPKSKGPGRQVVSVCETTKHRYFDVDLNAFAAARGRTLMQVLRDNGLRIEEAGELDLTDLKPMSVGDITIPTLYVKPSKQDRSRTLGLTVEALTAIQDLVTRARDIYGTFPNSVRFDDHESEEQQPKPLIFFQFRDRTFTGVAAEVLRKWLRDISAYYDENINTGPPVGRVLPHGMRRMLATELSERGAELTAIQQTLGHANLATTNTYLHLDERNAIAEVARVRRASTTR